MSFLRHGEIYRSDVKKSRERNRLPAPGLIGIDESPVGYSSAGWSPPEPASASPAAIRML